MGRRVVFVNRYFHPDHSATSQIASDLAFHLASRGWEVEAICSRQRYDDADAKLPKREVVRGVTITRIATTRFGRSFLPGRAIDYLTFYANAFFAMLRRRRSIIVAMTDPPLLSVVAAMASRNVVNWVQDLFPEVAEALGLRALRVLRPIRDWSLRRAKRNVVLGELMAARVPKATIIHNWADERLAPVEDRQSCLSGQAGLPVLHVGYSGNLGRAHEVDTMLAAMRMLPEVRFVFIGGGAQLERMKREAPPNVEFRPYAPRERLAESLSSVDAHFVSLQPSLEGLIVPSKFYGVIAVGRPVIFIGARDGEVARLIEQCRCGVIVEPGDVEGLVRAIKSIDREMGPRGRAMYIERFAPEHAFAAWERVLQEVTS
jgi:glycosyltransferase involved in cell wall biosynthesis